MRWQGFGQGKGKENDEEDESDEEAWLRLFERIEGIAETDGAISIGAEENLGPWNFNMTITD